MAPSAGHVHSYVVRNLQALKSSWVKAREALQARVIQPSFRPQLQAVPVRNGQPIHPVAYLKQLRSRVHSSSVRSYSTSSTNAGFSGSRYAKSTPLQSRSACVTHALPKRTPFGSTLRPNLTGGVLSRTAGGYSLGSGRIGGARFFSHGPAAPAEVVQNVSQAVRAFFLSGQKAHYDGLDKATGEKRFRAVTAVQDSAICKAHLLPKATPGSYVDFNVSPSITALAPIESEIEKSLASSMNDLNKQHTLNTDGLLDILSIDFSRGLQELAVVLNDLKRLSSLGDLPITQPSPSTLRVRFPGCDAMTIEAVCNELGVRRGIVKQDADFDAYVGTEMALLFPLAPSRTPSEEAYDTEGDDANKYLFTVARHGQPARNTMNHEDMISPYTSNKFSTNSQISLAQDDHWDHLLTEAEGTYHRASSAELLSSYETVSSGRAPDSGTGNVNVPLEQQSNRTLVQFIQLLDASKR